MWKSNDKFYTQKGLTLRCFASRILPVLPPSGKVSQAQALFYFTHTMKESVINELKSAYDVKGHKTVINGDTLLFLSQLKDPAKILFQLGVVTDMQTPIKCEVPCHECGKEVPQRHTAESMSILINNNYPLKSWKPSAVMCESCIVAENEAIQENVIMNDLSSKLYNHISDRNINANSEYLLHEFDALKNLSSYYQRALTSELIAMDYQTFLKTGYWAAVSHKVKYSQSNTCRNCGHYGESIDCHHKTYDRHGMEHIFWESDLVPLCRECHQEEHVKHPSLRAPKPVGETTILNSQQPF